ncbi:MAG: TolC family protein [Bacteroidales bacterium]|nr:TolC family protein [Bacteroidales bacterium]
MDAAIVEAIQEIAGDTLQQEPQAKKAEPRKERKKERTILDAEPTAEAQELSLEDAVSFALEHNKSLKASRLNMDLYKKKVMEAVSNGIPQINAGLSYQTNFGQEMDLGPMKIKMEDIMSFTASASWMIVNGQWIVGIQSSKIAQNLASQQTALDELDVKSNIYNSYYIVLVTEHLVNIVEANLVDMIKIQKHTENLYAAGALEESDVDQIRITVGQLNNTLLSMKRTLDVNYNLLRIQLGLKAGTPLTLTDPLEAFLGEEGITKLFSIEFDVTDNLTYQTTLTQEQLQKKALSAAKWACGPTLSAGYNYQYQIIEGGFMSIPHTAQVQLNVPIFSGLQRKAKIDQEKITLQQVQLNKSLLEDNLMLQEAQYKYNLQSALDNYDLQKENVKVAKSVLGHYQAKYEAGAISSLDLTQANTNYLTAENNYMSSCLELLQAQTNLLKLYNELQ